VIHPIGHAIVDQQARLVAARHGMLRNELRREVVLELPSFHPQRTVPLEAMDDGAVGRALEHLEHRAAGAGFDGLLVRAREQVEALANATAALEEALPNRVGGAIQEHAAPMARNLAEIRGLMNQLMRRLGSLENDLFAERTARVDDLALLVDLISSGWKGIDTRLVRLEETLTRLEQRIQDGSGAVVYRMEDRRPETASS
jgi:hypothetical protein